MPPISGAATVANVVVTTLVSVAAAGAACVAYGILLERRWYRLATYALPVLPPGPGANGGLSILHLSDLHFTAHDRRKAKFLAALPPADLAVVTGDLLGEPGGVESVVEALRPVRGRVASFFVLGSNDYFAPRPLNYLAYFSWHRKHRSGIRSRPGDLIAGLRADGWIFLKNRRTTVSSNGVRLEVVGLDDPHLERHDLRVALRSDPRALGLAVVHAPDPAPELAALGYDVVLSGHTHGGQVRFPFLGALVTNSTLPTRLAMGLSRLGRTFLHVSPGLGTSKYAPFRFLCRPEATLLELVRQPEAVAPTEDGPSTATANARS